MPQSAPFASKEPGKNLLSPSQLATTASSVLDSKQALQKIVHVRPIGVVGNAKQHYQTQQKQVMIAPINHWRHSCLSPDTSWRRGESRVSHAVAAAPIASLYWLKSYCLAQL
mmetsp:Transcript_4849/g.30935  ORF Transcript_4849/g.30935 Transcript_4849/m.30935 type:complete len:112 (+) Transcript_4849:401-736(+)|eukprot:CAMPEP_0183824524 /NCGR_PEP_ID=MMETSP0807_2-20130328/629_1 /TAXON_ID=88271 /ORGANISM="Picocystis salinarum, Strain CCMP1897" /LENGTH=111 /DNA_ID=CAMNT_0026069455 /DNA_START=339 /DNA_END=674 /DNA_ORIENTATION=-